MSGTFLAPPLSFLPWALLNFWPCCVTFFGWNAKFLVSLFFVWSQWWIITVSKGDLPKCFRPCSAPWVTATDGLCPVDRSVCVCVCLCAANVIRLSRSLNSLQAWIRDQRLGNAGIPSLSGRTSPNVKQQDNKKTIEAHDSFGSPASLLNGVRNGSVDDRWREREKSRGGWRLLIRRMADSGASPLHRTFISLSLSPFFPHSLGTVCLLLPMALRWHGI